MLIKLVAVGRLRDPHWLAKAEEFRKWLSPYAKIEVVELKDSTRERENALILEHLRDEKGFVAALSEDGGEFTSVELSEKLTRLDRKLVLVIGGPEGLLPEVKRRADLVWSLSRLTFTHEMARVLLWEQLFRALSIARGGKYHNF